MGPDPTAQDHGELRPRCSHCDSHGRTATIGYGVGLKPMCEGDVPVMKGGASWSSSMAKEPQKVGSKNAKRLEGFITGTMSVYQCDINESIFPQRDHVHDANSFPSLHHTSIMSQVQPDSQTKNLVTKSLGNGESFSLRASPTVPWHKTAATTCLWLASFPIWLPAGLVWFAGVSIPALRDYLFSIMIPSVMGLVDKEFKQERKTLLKNVTGTVIDVGSGGGAYLQYCKMADHVVAVEPNLAMHEKIREAGKELQKLSIMRDLTDIASYPSTASSFDWVIFGNVLCEVPHVPSTIAQVDSLLKPGGKIYFSEHIGDSPGTWRRCFQDWVNPLWRHAGGGCNCNRDSLDDLRKLSYDVVAWKYEHVRVCMGPMVLGLALKP